MFDDILAEASAASGLDTDLLQRIIQIESGGDPSAVTGSYKGLFQLGPDEWSRYGSGNIFDPRQNALAGAKKLADEAREFEAKYGRKPEASELYLIHQQGPGGFAAHMGNPDLPAWQSMASTLEGRQKGPDWAKRAIWGNVPDQLKNEYGSVDNLTSGQFINLWKNRVDGGANAAAGSGTKSMNPDDLLELLRTGDPGMGLSPDALAYAGRPTKASNTSGTNALLAMLGLEQPQPPQQSGLDPETMGYLAMIAKGLSPYSALEPQQMLAQAQRQKEARELAAQRQAEARQNLLLRLDQRQREQEATADQRREAAAERKRQFDIEQTRRRDLARDNMLSTKAAEYARETLPPGTEPGSPEWNAKTREWHEIENAKRKAAASERGRQPSAGYEWVDPNDPSQGMRAIKGGPADKLPSEMAARIGMANSFLDEVPQIRERITKGEISNPGGSLKAWMGRDAPGELRRKIDSGADAVIRHLTGAGMAIAEATDYARRYRFSPWDTDKDQLSKLNQLERELKYMNAAFASGRSADVLSGINRSRESSDGATRTMPTPEEAAAELARRRQGR